MFLTPALLEKAQQAATPLIPAPQNDNIRLLCHELENFAFSSSQAGSTRTRAIGEDNGWNALVPVIDLHHKICRFCVALHPTRKGGMLLASKNFCTDTV
jgi:hypothetical protein